VVMIWLFLLNACEQLIKNYCLSKKGLEIC